MNNRYVFRNTNQTRGQVQRSQRVFPPKPNTNFLEPAAHFTLTDSSVEPPPPARRELRAVVARLSLSARSGRIKKLMDAGWSREPGSARRAARAVAGELEGLSPDQHVELLEIHAPLSALGDYLSNPETSPSVAVLEPFAGLMTPAQVGTIGGLVSSGYSSDKKLSDVYNLLDTVRRINPDPLARRAAGRAAFGEPDGIESLNNSRVLRGTVEGFSREQLAGLAEAADDPRIERSFRNSVENQLPPGVAGSVLKGRDLPGERSLAEQISARAEEVREHQWETVERPLPGGGQLSLRTYRDEGDTITEATLADAGGDVVLRRTDQISRARETDDVEGLTLFSQLGQQNPQGLVDSLRNMGEMRVTDRKTLTEGLDSSGQPVESTEMARTWTFGGLGASLTRIDKGVGTAKEWNLTVPLRRDGEEGTETQRFFQGSDDTIVSRQYRDENGFAVSNESRKQGDLAVQVAARGDASIPTRVEGMVAAKEGGSTVDIRRFLTEQDLKELREYKGFEGDLEAFRNQKIDISYSRLREQFSDGRNEYREYLTLHNAAGTRFLVARSVETGGWGYVVDDQTSDAGRLLDQESVSEAARARKGAAGDVSSLRTNGKTVEAAINSVERGGRLGARVTQRLGTGYHGISRLLGKVDDPKALRFSAALGDSMDVMGMGVNAFAAAGHIVNGDHESAALSAAGAATDAGGLLRNGTSGLARAGRIAGYAGAAYTVFESLENYGRGEYVRGTVNLASGVGAGMVIASGATGVAGWLGPAGWGLSAGATLGGATYDYVDATTIARLEIMRE